MILYESVQDEIIEQFKQIIDDYNKLRRDCLDATSIPEEDSDLQNSLQHLYEFCHERLWEEIRGTKEDILDEYYPIDYADDEEDYIKSGERYTQSKEARENVF